MESLHRLCTIKFAENLLGALMGRVGACLHISCLKVNITFAAGTLKSTSQTTGRSELHGMDGQMIKLA